MTVTCGRCGWQGEETRYCARCGNDLSAAPGTPQATFPPPPLRPPAPGPVTGAPRVFTAIRPAGFWIRVVAVLIDGVVLIVAQGILFGAGWMLWGSGLSAGMAVKGATQLFSSLIGAAYTIAFHWIWGQTLGKMALGIKVIDADAGGFIGIPRGIGRYFARILSAIALGLGYLWMLWDPRKQCWHDKLVRSVVVRSA